MSKCISVSHCAYVIASTIYVGNGKDTSGCGSRQHPCRTIGFAYRRLPVGVGGMIQLMKVPNNVFVVKETITLTKPFHLVGQNAGISCVEVVGSYLVHLRSADKERALNVSVRIENIQFVVSKHLLGIKTRNTANAYISDCIFKRNGRLSSLCYVYVYGGSSKVVITRSHFSRVSGPFLAMYCSPKSDKSPMLSIVF